MSRRTARKHIFSMIFQAEFHSEEDIDEAISLYNDDIGETSISDKLFIKGEIEGILQNKDAIDEKINECAVGWSVARIAKVDIAILRIAVYEIFFVEDIPDNVSVNEAVELAKEFSSDKSPAFINGILGKIIEKR